MKDNIFAGNLEKKVIFLLTLFLFFIAIFFSTYKLTESPPVWMDEGVIVQTAKNLVEKGVYGLQVAPNKFVSSGFVTTSYPVIYPVALSFKLFGVGILQARVVMVMFILAFLLIAYFLIKKEYSLSVAFFSLALLVSFAPIYGHGKNVLGEIPGIFFLICFLFFMRKIEISDSLKIFPYAMSGILAGLAMSVKPIFLDLLSFSIIVSFFVYRPRNFPIRKVCIFGGVIIMMLLVWVYIHFSGDSFYLIISNYYGNPDHQSLLATIKNNLLKLLKEFQFIYFTLLILIWSVAVYLRQIKKSKISFVEIIAFIFSIVNFLAFFATLGFNRYFFPGQVLSIAYLPSSLFYLSRFIPSRLKVNRRAVILLPYLLLFILVLFQFYQTIFHSWVADYYGSKRSADLKEYFSVIPANKTILFYDVPEAVLFSSGDNYYQYIKFAENVQIGKESVDAIKNSVVDVVITNEKAWKGLKSANDSYKFKKEFDRYQIFERI